MRTIVLYQLISLDGVCEEPGDWVAETSERVFDNLAAIISTQTDVLLGRMTYDYWVDYWPTSNVEPFATFINEATKHVATATPLRRPWANTTTIDAPIDDYVAGLQATGAGDIGIHGSATLARSLLSTGLIDEMRLVVAPVIAGRGRRLLADLHDLVHLDLVDVQRDRTGTLFLHYLVGGPLGAPASEHDRR